jgi:hypothetical protein
MHVIYDTAKEALLQHPSLKVPVAQILQNFGITTEDSLMSNIGGHIVVTDNMEKLKEACLVYEKKTYGQQTSWFPTEIVDISDTHEHWFELCAITNNAGGTVYFIPDYISLKV